MFAAIHRTMRKLKRSISGNAAMLVALGMPALIGSSGLAVDVSQWYMWQRELQFAADQAALAGAWARSSTTTQNEYITRARQEFSANLATTTGGTSTPTVAIGNYNGGSNNAITVTAQASKPLPFTKFITGGNATVSVSATATFSQSHSYTACILSVNPTDNSSAIFGNAITGGSNCGVGALSTGTQAIVETGNSSVALGDIVSAGGIEDTFSNNGTIHEFVQGLSNPYASLTRPDPAGQPARSYTCPPVTQASTIWTATVWQQTIVTYFYYTNDGDVDLGPRDAGYLPDSDTSTPGVATTLYQQPIVGRVLISEINTKAEQVGKYNNKRLFRWQQTLVYRHTENVSAPTTTPGNDGTARLSPGVYSSINVQCATEFGSGIYWINGSIDFGQNKRVTGSDVLFVMMGTADSIHINSTSNVSLSGISANTLQTRYGYSAAAAARLKNMLFFDQDNETEFDINGNATVDFNGTLYMPSRSVKINGNMSGGNRCMMLVSNTFTVTGSANLSNFCPPSQDGGMQIGERTATVRLVA